MSFVWCIQRKPPNVYLSHEAFSSEAGSWAVTPLLSKNINKIVNINDTKWLIICEDQSVVDLAALVDNLKVENSTAVRM